MNKLLRTLENQIIITDGACGTYISSIAGRGTSSCEMLNLTEPETVKRMHKQYVDAGAKLIFTNTFCASEAGGSIGKSFKSTKKIISEGVRLSKVAAGNDAFVAADIGPLPEVSLDADILTMEYKRIADAFIDEGIENYVFETFADSKYPIMISEYIKKKLPDAFILVSFAVQPDGSSREGIRGQALIDDIKACPFIDAGGFNCCSGPSHLLAFATTVDYGNLIPSIMPNAGYPRLENDELTYSGSPEYFGEMLAEAAGSGFKIIGGCCGTTPRHIRCLCKEVGNISGSVMRMVEPEEEATLVQKLPNSFFTTLGKGTKKSVIVELEPPFDADISKIKHCARVLMGVGIDAVTIADSPMARARADSVAVAARLKRDLGVEVIPHICCRDKNLNAIKSTLIAARIEGVRNILAITGDPVSESDRGLVKSVFNFNSEGLCRFIHSLNDDIFKGDPIRCGCAFNANAANIDFEISRLAKKLEAGADFVLTQPIMTNEAVEAVKKAHAHGAKIFAGIMAPINYRNAMFLANEMPGFKLPQKYLDMFTTDTPCKTGEKYAVEISLECARVVAEYCDGFYFVVPFNRASVTERIIGKLREQKII